MTKSRLQKLRNIYRPNNDNTPLPKAIAELILRQRAKAYGTQPTHAHPLHKQKLKQNHHEPNGTWIIPDSIYDALHNCFYIQRALHCDPITLPLSANKFVSLDPLDT
jgi:hypothetical protein